MILVAPQFRPLSVHRFSFRLSPFLRFLCLFAAIPVFKGAAA
jgi:hypothetical protein